MRKLTRGVAVMILGSALAASALAQPPGTPAPPAPPPPMPVVPPSTPGTPAPPAPVVPPVTPVAKPEVRPTGTAALVNGKAIPEVAVYRALRQFPEQHKEMARKEILSHLIENTLIDEYLTALK